MIAWLVIIGLVVACAVCAAIGIKALFDLIGVMMEACDPE